MLKMLLQSFGDSKAYAWALENWRWKFVLYFLLLALISGFAVLHSMLPEIKSNIDYAKEFITPQFPNAKIENSRFSMSEKSPYFAKSKSGENIIAFTEDFIYPPQTKGLFMAFERDRLTIYFGNYENCLFYDELVGDYNKFSGLDSSANAPLLINKEKADEFLDRIGKLSFFIFTPFFVSVALIANAVLIVSITIPSFLLSFAYMPSLGLGGALKIAILAATPTIVLQTLQVLLGFPNVSEIFFVFVSYYIVWRVLRKLAGLERRLV